MTVDSPDVVVVGSGAGGAPTAALLAEAGLDVLILEEGPDVRQGDVVPFSLDQMEQQYRAAGVTAALGRPSIAYTEACCVGGGTEINSGLFRRPPPDVIERWRADRAIEDFSPADLDVICDEIETVLSVQPLPGPAIGASTALQRGAEHLGWANDEIPRWMTYPSGTTAGARRQSMSETYLPRAVAAGARVLAGHRVDRIVHDSGKASGVLVTDDDGRTRRVAAGAVFVCAGAIQTPALLQRSGWRRGLGAGLAVHPTVKLAARFDDELNVPDDVPVHQVKEFAPDLSFGGSASSPGLIALALSDAWDRFGAAIEDWKQIAVYYAAITSEGRGRVVAVPGVRDPVVTYRLTRRDRDLLGRGLARLALVLLEAGAREVYPSYRGAPVVRGRRDLAAMQGTFRATAASVMTVHLCSGAAMGGEATGAPTDSFGRLRAASNVFVNDASLLPDAPGVNPQATIMAIAIRNARRYLDRRGVDRDRCHRD